MTLFWHETLARLRKAINPTSRNRRGRTDNCTCVLVPDLKDLLVEYDRLRLSELNYQLRYGKLPDGDSIQTPKL